MICASRRTVGAWNNGWKKAGHFVYSMMTGALPLYMPAHLWQTGHLSDLGVLALVTTGLGYLAKRQFRRFPDTTRSRHIAQTATGLGGFGTVRLLDAPHTEENCLLQEMGFQFALKHAAKLRRVTLVAAFAAPFPFNAEGVTVCPCTEFRDVVSVPVKSPPSTRASQVREF